MQMVTGLFSSISSGVSQAAGAIGGAFSGPGGPLAAARIGTSALSAISGYAMNRMQADQMDSEAGFQNLQANQDFIQAQQKSNEVMRNYRDVVGGQVADAAGMGIDVASGSVQAAKARAENITDQQLNTIRSNAVMDAGLRRARAAYLQGAASQTRTAGLLGAITKIGTGFLNVFQTGGPSGSGGAMSGDQAVHDLSGTGTP